eukprot:jgi/Psemu1/59156/gm1.59156_g
MLQGQRPYHPFTDFTNYKHNEWEMVCKCRDFLEDASLHAGNCKSITTSNPLKCNCLKFLDKSIAREAIALYMVAFFNKSKVDQQLTIMDWLRYTCLEGKPWFFVPFLNPYEEGGKHDFIDEDTPEKHAVLAALSQTRICRYAISVLLDWGRRKWETRYRNLDDNTTPTHGLKGKRPHSTMEFDESTIVEDLVNFFDELKELGQQQSTRIMQVETGVGLRDGEEGVVESPPSFSKEVSTIGFVMTGEPNRYFLNKKKKVDVEEVLVERKTRKNNKILMGASLHVKQGADQRQVYSMKIKEAHHDYLHTVQHSEPRCTLVVDYCQNAQLPNLGATQPGNTYYMTPLTIAILGIVDCSLEGGSLDAFAYHEGIGGKGGDNVASMIVILLKHKGWMKENEVGGELTVLMDNCGGQNKNNHVLRLANLLVEAGYFKKNLYTFEQLRKALDTNERITIHSVKDSNFKHYKWLKDLFCKDLKTGTIQPGHIFTVESDAPTTIKIWQDCLGTADVSVQDLQKRVTMDCDCQLWEAVRDFVLLDPVAPTGIKEITDRAVH